jgi:hypothetical protein
MDVTMIYTPLAPTYEVYINVRPIKVAYFVCEDDEESLLRILRFVNTQWGGIRNLIIPVSPTGQIIGLFRDLLKIHEPEWFVSYLPQVTGSDQTPNEDLQNYLQQLFPERAISVQVGSYFETHDYRGCIINYFTYWRLLHFTAFYHQSYGYLHR